eukprot:1178070-Prorocentrum_minimum.AAC.6
MYTLLHVRLRACGRDTSNAQPFTEARNSERFTSLTGVTARTTRISDARGCIVKCAVVFEMEKLLEVRSQACNTCSVLY